MRYKPTFNVPVVPDSEATRLRGEEKGNNAKRRQIDGWVIDLPSVGQGEPVIVQDRDIIQC